MRFFWKINFNRDPTKHAQVVIFWRKMQKQNNSTLSITILLNSYVTKMSRDHCVKSV